VYAAAKTSDAKQSPDGRAGLRSSDGTPPHVRQHGHGGGHEASQAHRAELSIGLGCGSSPAWAWPRGFHVPLLDRKQEKAAASGICAQRTLAHSLAPPESPGIAAR
jgi:hypothetical protein